MKKILFCLTLILGLTLLGATSSFALTVHDAIYHWQDGGTIVSQVNPSIAFWAVGNPVGWDPGKPNFEFDLIEVHEKVSDDGAFFWDVINDDYDDLYSFHVRNVGIKNIISHDEPDDWTFSFDDEWFTWTTTADPIGGHFDSGTFRLRTYGTGKYGISASGVDLDASHTQWENAGGFWVASHPVPEPASMALLGLGLVGLIGSIRKKFMA